MIKFFNKKIQERKVTYAPTPNSQKEVEASTYSIPTPNMVKEENKGKMVIENMDTKEKVALASKVLADEAPVKAKRIRKDKGLIERTESSTIILTEENKELLHD